MPPLLAPVIRLSISGTQSSAVDWGIRSFFAYSGSTAPSAGDLAAINTEVGSAWTADVEPIQANTVALTKIVTQDLTTATGLESVTTGAIVGTRSGTAPEAALAMNISYGILRRYRGGHPRVYLPCGVTSDIQDPANWTSAFVTLAQSAWTNFIAAVAGTTGLSCGSLSHVNVSFYNGFNTIGPYPDGKFHYPPKPRTTPLIDTVISHVAKQLISSQKRRRTATTP